MSSYYTSNRFINAVKRSAAIPTFQGTFTDEDILEIASEEIDISVVPQITELHEDYFLFSEDIEIVPGKKAYDIPYRALGNKLRDVAWVDSGGKLFEMKRIPVDYLSDYNTSAGSVSEGEYYYVQNNQIIPVPEARSSTGKFRFFYYFRPNRLVKNERAGVITGIDLDTNTISVNNTPEHFAQGMMADLIQERNPHKTLDYDIEVIAVNFQDKQVTLSRLPDGLRIGDHVAKAEECIIPQIPSEIHPVLVQRTVYRIVESLGDAQASQLSAARIGEMENKTQKIIDNRVEASPPKIVQRNGFMSRLGARRRRTRI